MPLNLETDLSKELHTEESTHDKWVKKEGRKKKKIMVFFYRE